MTVSFGKAIFGALFFRLGIALSLISLIPLPLSAQASPPKATTATDEEIELEPEGNTEINIKNADIAAIIRIFSKRTKRNYILDENIKGKVSIYLPGKVTEDEALRILDSTLAMKGFTSVPVSENLWKIVPLKDAKQSTIPTRLDTADGPVSAATVTRLLALKFVNADDIKQLITPLISGEGLVTAYTGTNSLILIDAEDNIERIANIISALDVPSTDRDMTIIPIKNAEAQEIADKLNEILGTSSGTQSSAGAGSASFDLLRERIRENALQSAMNARNAANQSGAPAAGALTANLAGGKTIAARAREPKIIADDRTNAVIVVADEDTTARIQALVSQLDSKVDLSGNRFYVYRCQHASATELAEVLGGVVGAGTGSTGSSSRSSFGGLGSEFGEDSGVGTSTSRSRSNSRNSGTGLGTNRGGSSSARSSSNRTTGGSTGSRGTSAVQLGENTSITADPATNSLIIMAGKQDYTRILELLEKLDIKRRQVLVEAMLLEVGVTDDFNAGTDWITSGGGADGGFLAGNNAGNIVSVLRDPERLSGFSIAAASAGSLKLPGFSIPSQSVLLSAAQSNSNVNVLSAPTILATDNEPAEIVVGQNVPFIASQATNNTNLDNTINQIDRQDVGITLRITPQINSEDSVTLQIFTEVSNVIESTLSSNLGPTTTIRTSETTAITRDSQMIVIGGLMADNVSDTDSGVPFFQDIPVLGHLFKESRENRRRTNLLIFITPRIVKDQFDARDATVEKRDVFSSEMRKGQVFPDRQEVLQDPAIDNVAELSPYTGPKPSTITAPKRLESDKPHVSGKQSAQGADSPNQALQLKVAPKLPDEVAGSKPAQKKAAPAPAKQDMYLVMQLSDSDKGRIAELPFHVSAKDLTFGVIVPADSSSLAQSYFSVGSQCAYQIDSRIFRMQPIGAYNSSQQARELHPELHDSWHTLSPYEIMNLGTGPWLSSGSKK
jgi:general secretion pathway protein D